MQSMKWLTKVEELNEDQMNKIKELWKNYKFTLTDIGRECALLGERPDSTTVQKAGHKMGLRKRPHITKKGGSPITPNRFGMKA
jgi:hypothetical protein